MKDIIMELWNLAESLVKGIGSIWDWLNTGLKLGFDLPIIGYVGIPEFIPIQMIGAGMVGILIFWVVKALVPFL